MSAPSPRQMYTLIERQAAHMSRLHALLKEDNAALHQRNTEQFEKHLAEKEHLSADIELIDREYKVLLEAADCTPDRAGMEEYIRRHDPDMIIGLGAQWEALFSLMTACQRQNRINGGIVELGRHHMEQVLAVLRGHTGKYSSGYGPEGKTQHGIQSHSLGKV